MARPKKNRLVCSKPNNSCLIPAKKAAKTVEMTIDEYEAVRLIDYVGLTQFECAKQMQVARSTVTSVYDSARYKISDSLINNKGLTVLDGGVQVCPNHIRCCGHCGKNRCGRCNHGECERCIGIFHPPGEECFVVQYN
ncbi:MAG: DUF134 domain-containing protein [Clostridiales bacterium]|nr:DUF134 domain-containing protein [Clostridiales bacterium]